MPIQNHTSPFDLIMSKSVTIDATNALMCQAFDYLSAVAVFGALCRQFPHVRMYDATGAEVLKYCNLYPSTTAKTD